MHNSASHPYCIATVVTDKAIDSMLEAGGDGTYKDTHPWLLALDMFDAATQAGELVPILFASMHDDGRVTFTNCSTIDDLSVVELHRATWDTISIFNIEFSTVFII